MKVAFYTLGCKVNHYETEAIREAFVSCGAETVSGDEYADAYVINTCTVTNTADRKSRQFIRRAKRVNPDAVIVVTGCYAQVAPEDIGEMPEVDLIIGNGLKGDIADRTFELIKERRKASEKTVEQRRPVQSVLEYGKLTGYEDLGILKSPGSGGIRAYIKIEEGCDRFCSYCLIPYARGSVRSRNPDDIVEEAAGFIGRGCRELVLTGINTALYGTEKDFRLERRSGEAGMSGLEVIINRISGLDGDFRIRLSSLEPTVVDQKDVSRLLGFGKLCRHLHLSIQSGSDRVLKLMNRRYTADDYLGIVRAVKEFDPDYGITTDIIAGFPGETREDHEESLRIIEEAGFARVHVFRFSPRRGTKAWSMEGAINGKEKNRRAAELADAAAKSFAAFVEQNKGRPHRFLAEERADGYVNGYTDNYIRTYVEDPECTVRPGEFYDVRITGMIFDGASAVIQL